MIHIHKQYVYKFKLLNAKYDITDITEIEIFFISATMYYQNT